MRKKLLGSPGKGLLLVATILVVSLAPASAQTVGAFRETGERAIADGDYYSAIEAFSAALRVNPRDFPSTLGMAEAYYWLGEYDQAGLIADRARMFSRNDPAVLNLSGRISIGLGDLEAARAFFDSVRALEPNNVEAEIGLAELALAEGKNLDAQLALERALRIRPDHEKALLSLVLVFEQAGDFQTAEDYLEIALETHSNEPETHILAAEYALRRGNNAEAALQARTAQALDATNESAARIRATVALLDGRYEEAIATAEELLRLDRMSARTWFLRGQALIASGRVAEGIDSFRTALRYDPDNEIIRLVAENVALLELPMDDAIRVEFAAYQRARAASLAEGFLYSKALSAYQRALRLTPFDSGMRLAYAELHNTLGHAATYLEELTVIAEADPADAGIQRRISIYTNLLSESVANRWNIDQFTLQKSATYIGVYLADDAPPLTYPLAERSLLPAIARSMRSFDRVRVYEGSTPVDFPAAFASARSQNVDFFILLRPADSARSFALEATVHVGRTGVEVASLSIARTGPSRVSDAIDALSRRVNDMFPLLARVVRRRGDRVVIDAGLRDGVSDGMELTVLPAEAILIEPGAMAYAYEQRSVLGTLTVTATDDLVSEATISVAGLVDAIAMGDIAVIMDTEAVIERSSAILYPLLYDRVRALR